MMKRELCFEGDLRILLLLTLWASVVLLLMSMDSPIHHFYNRCDSAYFFMGGKAMMNGLRPYVDFTDTKGPLLWLIYGVGYLISPRDYIGVYVLSCLCYGGVLYYNYKTARLLLGDSLRSLMVALLMPWFYFLYWFHNEVRAEDFCDLPLTASLYYLFHLLYNSGNHPYCVRRYGMVLGVSFMALVLIKFNIAAMQGLMLVFALWHYFRDNHRSALVFIGWTGVGMCLVAIPFLVYFLFVGSLGAFYQEYFVNTFVATTTYSSRSKSTFTDELIKWWSNPSTQALLLFIVGGGWLGGRLLSYWRYLPWLLGLWFYLLSIRYSYPYYYSICYILCLFPLVYMVKMVNRPLNKGYLVAAMAVVLCWGVFDNIRERSKLTGVTRWCSGKDSINYANIQKIVHTMDGTRKPRIINLFSNERGFGLESEALPAGNRWTFQFGTPEMKNEHIALLKSGKADFVIVDNEKKCNSKGFTCKVIESYGYQQVLRQKYSARETAVIYRKKKSTK